MPDDNLFDGSDIEEKNLRKALARHAYCWKGKEVDPSFVAAGVKKALAPRSEVNALDRVEAAWSSLKEYFTLNVSIERVFRILVAHSQPARHISSRRSGWRGYTNQKLKLRSRGPLI